MKGNIFDIQKFSLHDGPGIRTVVFFKGCPLSCTWCSNPESQSTKPQLMYLRQHCKGYGECVSVCAPGAIKSEEKHIIIDYDLCTLCGDCIDVCPTKALKICGVEMSIQEVLEELLKDKAFYEKSGGGITLSGGEALQQLAFAQELLKEAKRENLHTALETSGMVSKSALQKVLPYVDLFLYDYKMSDPGDLEKHTSANRKIIMDNLEFLNRKGVNIILRCLIIPGMNDNDAHFRQINQMYHYFPSILSVDLIPYHQFGKSKYEQLGRTFNSLYDQRVDKKTTNEWKEKLLNLGCDKVEVV